MDICVRAMGGGSCGVTHWRADKKKAVILSCLVGQNIVELEIAKSSHFLALSQKVILKVTSGFWQQNPV